jgi:malonyl-CoA O-methyltransferase
MARRIPKVFERNLQWLRDNSHFPGGVCVSSVDRTIYPEVTGYLIPSLLNWGEIELANNYAKHLSATQDVDGSYWDPSCSSKCLFDTGQILRGFLAMNGHLKSDAYLSEIEKSLEWIDSLIDNDGDIKIPEISIWGGAIPEAIILYALEPALRAAILLNNPATEKKLLSVINRILQQPDLTRVRGLNHFHAYIIEALIDLGHIAIAEKAMDEVVSQMRFNGFIPGSPGKKWSCSTGQFQYSVILYKLGHVFEADKIMDYAIRRQNRSGGWFGTLNRPIALLSLIGHFRKEFQTYFYSSEIPWANKYFMDAMSLRLKAHFKIQSASFSDTIESSDGRLKLLQDVLIEKSPTHVLDAGCGKGRYLHVSAIIPGAQFSVMDISKEVMSGISEDVKKFEGSLTNTGIESATFDFVYTIESLEHCVSLYSTIREISRIIKPGGTWLIIDKDLRKLGRLVLPEWEQWFDPNSLAALLIENGFEVQIKRNIQYEGKRDGLFVGWIASKSK